MDFLARSAEFGADVRSQLADALAGAIGAAVVIFPFTCLTVMPPKEPPIPCICFVPTECRAKPSEIRCYLVLECGSPRCPR